jgi:HAD superfamily hydrolase (TIGR01509 family)
MSTLFCDVGGVLIRNPWVDTSQALSERYGVPRAEAFGLLTSLSRELDADRISLRDYNRQLGEALRHEVPYGYFIETVDSALKRVPVVWGAVKKVKDAGEVRVVALSNMSKEVWASLQEKFEIGSLFHSAVLSFEVGALKPDPKIYRLALEASGEEASDCVFVDDVAENIQAAKALGLRTFLARKPPLTAAFLRGL